LPLAELNAAELSKREHARKTRAAFPLEDSPIICAILGTTDKPVAAQEGARTMAAVVESRFGRALKISENGVVSFYRGGVGSENLDTAVLAEGDRLKQNRSIRS
jgi:hypothetical protein